MDDIDSLITGLSEAALANLARKLSPLLSEISLRTFKVWGDTSRLHVSKNCNFNDAIFNVARGQIYVGDYTFFGHSVMVLTGRHPTEQIDSDRMYPPPGEGRDIVIGRGVWIASGAIIIGPCRIGDHAVIAAGSVVRHNVPDGWLYAGNPAHPIKQVVNSTRVFDLQDP